METINFKLASAFPVIEEGVHTTKVIVSRLGDVVAPIQDELTQVSYVDVDVSPNSVSPIRFRQVIVVSCQLVRGQTV